VLRVWYLCIILREDDGLMEEFKKRMELGKELGMGLGIGMEWKK
jgi:hypothetical protein